MEVSLIFNACNFVLQCWGNYNNKIRFKTKLCHFDKFLLVVQCMIFSQPNYIMDGIWKKLHNGWQSTLSYLFEVNIQRSCTMDGNLRKLASNFFQFFFSKVPYRGIAWWEKNPCKWKAFKKVV
jgi:hypothetical protein